LSEIARVIEGWFTLVWEASYETKRLCFMKLVEIYVDHPQALPLNLALSTRRTEVFKRSMAGRLELLLMPPQII
jgi:hypothetical protein